MTRVFVPGEEVPPGYWRLARARIFRDVPATLPLLAAMYLMVAKAPR